MKTFELMRLFEKSGFSFYSFGTIKEGKKKIADFYKGDLTPKIKQKLIEHVPNVYFLNSQKQFAPEIKENLVCIPVKKSKS